MSTRFPNAMALANSARAGCARRSTSFFVLALLSTGFASGGFSPLAGRVVEAGTKRPVIGARIVGTISGRTTWSGSDGGFELPGVEATEDSVAPIPEVRGGSGLVLTGSVDNFEWISPAGTTRLLATGDARIEARDIPIGFGWIRTGSGGRQSIWSVFKIGSGVEVRAVPRVRLAGGATRPTVPESLSVRWSGIDSRTVRVATDSVFVVELERGLSVAGDFHTHTYLTDGSHDLDDVAAHAFGGTYALRDANGNPMRDSTTSGYGMDWFANSEHGGAFDRDRFGRELVQAMWRWKSLRDLSWPAVDSLRQVYPKRFLFQGLEWNVPAHDHASVGIIASDPDPISRFEFFFDDADRDTQGAGWSDATGKDRSSSHAKALAGARWLREHHGDSSWIVINHPSRLLRARIQDLRDFQDAGGAVFLGIEAIPGHQKGAARGGYSYTPLSPALVVDARTHGGVDRLLARVGGGMDALWSEGRRVWVFANSDFHWASGTDHYPGEYAKNLTRISSRTESGILAGLRSGATVAVMGDLVDSFAFELDDGHRTASMGQELTTTRDSVDVLVRFHVPARNALGDVPVVDHVDLIRGGFRSPVASSDPDYSTDSVGGVSVVASLSVGGLATAKDGWHEVVWRQPSDRSGYFRIRGTSVPRASAGLTDASGNPLRDDLQYPNNDAKARSNLWFYSNPVFLKRW
jgi:hypothetical protein